MAEYAPLLQEDVNCESKSRSSDDLGSLSPDLDSRELHAAHGRSQSIISSRIIRYSILVIVLCSIIDGVLLVVALYHSSQSNVPMVSMVNPYLSQESIDALPVKNTYINFDKLYGPGGRKSAPRPAVINMARAFAHVSSQEPGKKESQWLDSTWATTNGYIPLDNRRLWVTPEVSTIAQFRVLDWGMENCTIVLDVPSELRAASDSHAKSHWRRAVSATSLKLHELDAPHKLNIPQLSYSTKPRRLRELATVDLVHGEKIELPTFHCRSGSYFTVEVSCDEEVASRAGECNLDFLAIDRELSGLYIRQTQTV